MQRNSAPRRRAHSGFTLIELVVVIVILAILAAIVVPRFFGRTEEAKRVAAVSQVKVFEDCIGLYNADTGKFPETLDALIHDPGVPKWHGPYLKNQETVPNDPWEHPYKYVIPGTNGRDYDIISDGPDGKTPIVNGKVSN